MGDIFVPTKQTDGLGETEMMRMNIVAKLTGKMLMTGAIIFCPQIAAAEDPAWGSPIEWTRVSASSRVECELKAEKALRNYSTLHDVKRRGIGAQGMMNGKDAMFVVFCSPKGDQIFLFDICPDSVCREADVIQLRNQLGEEIPQLMN
jgi:hypothetical protein